MPAYSRSGNEARRPSKLDTRQLVVVALMCAISILLSFVEFPIIPAASFLKLDIALVPSTVVGFAYGIGPGLLCAIASAIAHAIITGDWVGAIMNSIVALSFIAPSALVCRRMPTLKGQIIGLSVATVCLVVAISIANLIIDPIFYGLPLDAVAALVVPAIIPFNVIKGVLVSVLTILAYRSVQNMIVQPKSPSNGK